MKFIHIADMHFDSPFVNLSDRETLGDKRRLEQRKILKKIIEYIKQEKIEYLFISGDLYEHKYVKQSTIEYINNLFKEIPETKVFIAPGNHDPNIKNSYYNRFNWNENVKIFKGKIEKIETQEAQIYGFGFDDFYCNDSGIQEVEVDNTDKIKILVIHGTLDGANIEEKQYNSISTKTLEEKGFDYVALGHIHKPDYTNKKIVYPGSTSALGFDELGEHGMIVGEIQKVNKEAKILDINQQNTELKEKSEFTQNREALIELKFVPLDEEKFVKKEIDVTTIQSKEELIEKINETKIEENEYVEIVLAGKRNFEINNYEIIKYIENEKIIKIKNNTKIAYDLEKMANETTLKGLFVKKMLEKYKEKELNEKEQEIIEKAIEIGFDALE